jgi:hypothetical protein
MSMELAAHREIVATPNVDEVLPPALSAHHVLEQIGHP